MKKFLVFFTLLNLAVLPAFGATWTDDNYNNTRHATIGNQTIYSCKAGYFDSNGVGIGTSQGDLSCSMCRTYAYPYGTGQYPVHIIGSAGSSSTTYMSSRLFARSNTDCYVLAHSGEFSQIVGQNNTVVRKSRYSQECSACPQQVCRTDSDCTSQDGTSTSGATMCSDGCCVKPACSTPVCDGTGTASCPHYSGCDLTTGSPTRFCCAGAYCELNACSADADCAIYGSTSSCVEGCCTWPSVDESGRACSSDSDCSVYATITSKFECRNGSCQQVAQCSWAACESDSDCASIGSGSQCDIPSGRTVGCCTYGS